MANEATVTSATEFVLTEMINEVVYRAAYAQSRLPALVRFASLAGVPTRVQEFPKDPLLSAAAVSEGTDLANSTFNPTSVSVTCGEVGLMITPTDMLIGASIFGLDHFVEQLGLALGTKKDTDIAANSSSLTNFVGTTTVDLTETQFLEARYTIINGNGLGDLFAWLAPVQVFDLQKDIATSAGAIWGASQGPAAELGSGQGMMCYGVLVFGSTTVPTANAAADRGGFMAPIGTGCGIAYVEKRPERVEAQRDASLRATELVATADYGTGCPNIAANGGVGIITDA